MTPEDQDRVASEQDQYPVEEPELPVAVAHISDPDAFDAYEVIPVYTAAQMHEHYQAGARAAKGEAMSKDTSGPAFPMMRDQSHEERFIIEPGMTLRQWYAGLAMQGLIARGALTCTLDGFSRPFNEKEVTDQAFAMADAMIAEGSKQ